MATKANPGEFDCYDQAAEDEPIFILRAKDPLSPAMVRIWCQMRRMTRQPWTEREDRKLAEAHDVADQMEAWREGKVAELLANGEGEPDIDHHDEDADPSTLVPRCAREFEHRRCSKADGHDGACEFEESFL